MADSNFSSDPLIIKVTAGELRAGRRILIAVLNDSENADLSHFFEVSQNLTLEKGEDTGGDFWVSVGQFNN